MAHQLRVCLEFHWSGRPREESLTEGFQSALVRRMPEPVLVSLRFTDARRTIEDRREGFNTARAHRSFARRIPIQIAVQSKETLNRCQLVFWASKWGDRKRPRNSTTRRAGPFVSGHRQMPNPQPSQSSAGGVGSHGGGGGGGG